MSFSFLAHPLKYFVTAGGQKEGEMGNGNNWKVCLKDAALLSVCRTPKATLPGVVFRKEYRMVKFQRDTPASHQAGGYDNALLNTEKILSIRKALRVHQGQALSTTRSQQDLPPLLIFF